MKSYAEAIDHIAESYAAEMFVIEKNGGDTSEFPRDTTYECDLIRTIYRVELSEVYTDFKNMYEANLEVLRADAKVQRMSIVDIMAEVSGAKPAEETEAEKYRYIEAMAGLL